MKKLLIIKTGTTFATIRQKYGDFEDYIIDRTGMPASDVVVAPVYIDKTLPPLTDVSAVIITGSHAMVTDRADWSRRLAHWLRHMCGASVPVLGLCFGHQILADAWGGAVDYHPRGQEVGTVEIELNEAGKKDPVLGCLPDKFLGHVYHAQSVLELPPAARPLARNAFEPHHAFVLHDNIWGVQFHPEFDAAVMLAYIEEEREALIREGFDVEKLQASLQDNSYGQLLLRRFVSLV
ncbi:glutamine amidotransferase [Anaeroselena agilis]|uniref:Glutamine amidotransferase n=1 Tax=Anaeroselena agilis TaxID=3063788 RepID=A0ABU3P037_9FIRM|nr:glutamine amidotransferase [Selenomonadales bacterium 4137-cl]